MNTLTKIAIIGGSVLALAGAYLYYATPSISVLSIDKPTKTANIKIGNKNIKYVYDINSLVKIPINVFYGALIQPVKNQGDNIISEIIVMKGQKIIKTETINFK
jgi:hypothetical protein